MNTTYAEQVADTMRATLATRTDDALAALTAKADALTATRAAQRMAGEQVTPDTLACVLSALAALDTI